MPKIDLSSIPGLDSAQALFGAVSDIVAGGANDAVGVMIYTYVNNPPPPPPGLF